VGRCCACPAAVYTELRDGLQQVDCRKHLRQTFTFKTLQQRVPVVYWLPRYTYDCIYLSLPASVIAMTYNVLIHNADDDATQLSRQSVLNSQLVHDGFSSKNWKLNMLRIYPVELAAELETGSRLPTGEYTSPDTTQLNSTCSGFILSTKSVGSRRELVVNLIQTVRRRYVCWRYVLA